MNTSAKKAGYFLWWTFDAIALAAFVAASLTWPIQPPNDKAEAVYTALARLVITLLVLFRLARRSIPLMLNAAERINVRVFVASRFLRAKKSGFLGAITALALLAVTVSSCALTTTLSVMGGFRTDLKRKILGNTAHIVISPQSGKLEGWQPIIDRVDSVKGIKTTAPFLSAEVMVSSATNLSGALLRGMSTDALSKVTNLPSQLRSGKLEYLDHPEKLLNLEDEERDENSNSSSKKKKEGALKKEKHLAKQTDIPSTDDILDTMMIPEPLLAPREVLPGLIIGQELARALRLFVGDDVNVVSPRGDLGPSGPMPKTRPFRIAGIFYSGMYEYDMKHIYMTLDSAQKFLGVGDSISGIESKVNAIEKAPSIATKIRAALAPLHRSLSIKDWRQLNSNLFGALALEKLAMFVTLGIAILVASFCVISLLSLMVQEKRRGVAILKAMGGDDRSIVYVFILAGAFIGVFGAAMGLSLGYLICFLAEHFVLPALSAFGLMQVDLSEVYYLDKLPVNIDPIEFLLVGIASVVVCILVTIYPAILASRIRPVDALREH
ncbi:MAG: FtsX-like permease family protein [Myxococcales bacterium]|nr:MAG: FtsX-like permease family protein [Myxococcales bacterium]